MLQNANVPGDVARPLFRPAREERFNIFADPSGM